MSDSTCSLGKTVITLGRMSYNDTCIFMPGKYYRFLVSSQVHLLRSYCFDPDLKYYSDHREDVIFALSLIFQRDASKWSGRDTYHVLCNMVKCMRSYMQTRNNDVAWTDLIHDVALDNRLDHTRFCQAEITKFFSDVLAPPIVESTTLVNDINDCSTGKTVITLGEMSYNDTCIFMANKYYRLLVLSQVRVLQSFCRTDLYCSEYPVDLKFALSLIFQRDASKWPVRNTYDVFCNMVKYVRSDDFVDWFIKIDEVVRHNRLVPPRFCQTEITKFLSGVRVPLVSESTTLVEDVGDGVN